MAHWLRDSRGLEMLKCCSGVGGAGSPVRPLGNRLGFFLRVSAAGWIMWLSRWAEEVAGEAHLFMEVRKDSDGVEVQEEICKGPRREI